MKFLLYPNRSNPAALALCERAGHFLRQNGHTVLLAAGAEGADMLLVFGGDGTLLRARARAARGLPGMVRQLRAPGVSDGLRACPGGGGAAPAAGWRLSPGKAHADARRAQRSAGVYRAERDGAAPRGLSARAISVFICKRSAGHASAWGMG